MVVQWPAIFSSERKSFPPEEGDACCCAHKGAAEKASAARNNARVRRICIGEGDSIPAALPAGDFGGGLVEGLLSHPCCMGHSWSVPMDAEFCGGRVGGLLSHVRKGRTWGTHFRAVGC